MAGEPRSTRFSPSSSLRTEIVKLTAAATFGAMSVKAIALVAGLFVSPAANGQVTIPSTAIPPTAERSIIFTDAAVGKTYIVGVDSGKVVRIDALPGPAPNPIPDDGPIPQPDPPAPQESFDFAVLIVDPADPAQQPLRTDTAIRDAVKARGAIFRSILTNEEDVAKLGIQSRVDAAGTPYLILLKKNADGRTSKMVGEYGKIDRAKALEVLK